MGCTRGVGARRRGYTKEGGGEWKPGQLISMQRRDRVRGVTPAPPESSQPAGDLLSHAQSLSAHAAGGQRRSTLMSAKHALLFKTLDEVTPERRAPAPSQASKWGSVPHSTSLRSISRGNGAGDGADLRPPTFSTQRRAGFSPVQQRRPSTAMGFSGEGRRGVGGLTRTPSDEKARGGWGANAGGSSAATIPAAKGKGKQRICIAYGSSSRSFLRLIARMLGWEVVEEEAPADVQWVVSTEQLQSRMRKLEPMQYCARIPGMYEMCNKCKFSIAMDLGKRLFPDMLDFWPESWVLPEQFRQLKAVKDARRQWTFIIKPGDGAQGDGITLAIGHDNLIKQLHDHEAKFKSLDVVVQRYIADPMLLKGFKFDLRVYAYIRVVEPLEVYVCREGLARLCTIPYKKPAPDNIHQTMLHLTNYSLNKKSENYTHARNDGDESGTKRTITSAFNELRRAGHDVDELWKKIDILVARTMTIVQPCLLAESLSLSLEDNCEGRWAFDGGPGCFHIVGVDVMLDNSGNPYLLEINASPRQAIDSIVPLSEFKNPDGNEKICECDECPEPHIHRVCEIDKKAKTIAVGGAIQILMNKRKEDIERNTKKHEPKKALAEASDSEIIKKPPLEFRAVFMGGPRSKKYAGAAVGVGDGGNARRAGRVAGTLESHYIQVCSGSRNLKEIVAMSCGMSRGHYAKR